MPRPSSLVWGQHYGRLFPIRDAEVGYTIFQCTCGNLKKINKSNVARGLTKSCGCLHREVTSAAFRKANTTHGKSSRAIYFVWASMISRCANPKNHQFKNYGGRGIAVCREWLSFESFYADMGDAPEGLSLEREKNEEGYSKANCVWATATVQGNNRRSCRLLTFEGRTQNVTQWANELDLDRFLLYDRVKAGWPDEKILTQPTRKRA